MKAQALLLGLCLLFCSSYSYSQLPELKFRNLSNKEGLSCNIVTAVFQDSKGRMWISTADGLNLFDGTKFNVYRNNPNDPNTILNNQINCFLEIDNNHILMGTNSGLNIYIPESDQFLNINRLIKGDTIRNNILNISQDKKGIIWMSSAHGMFRLDYKKKVLRKYSIDIAHADSLQSSLIVLNNDNKDNLWIGTASKGLFLFDKKKNRFYRFKAKGYNSEEINTIRSICEDSQGNVWFGTDLYLGQYNPQTKDFTKYTYNYLNKKGAKKGMVRYIFEDNRKNLWIGFQYGLAVLDRQTNEFTHIIKNEKDNNSIAGDEVWHMTQDKEGNVWFGFYNSGIAIHNPSFSQFGLMKHEIDNDNSLMGNSILSIAEDKEDNIWIGVDHKGLDCYNPKTKKYTHYKSDPINKNSLSSDAINSIDIDHEGILWLGTWGGGLNRFNPKNNSFTHFLPDLKNPYSIKAIHTWKALEDKYNNLIIATQMEGMIYYKKNENKFYSYINDPNNPQSISYDAVNSIIRDKNNDIFIGTGKGMNKLNYSNFSFKRYAIGKEMLIIDLYDDNKGKVWAAGAGLFVFDKKTEKFTRLFSNYNFPILQGILEDSHDNLWISATNLGFIKINTHTQKIEQIYTLKDGIPAVTFNKRARAKLSNGKMLFGTTEGIVVFHPDSIKNKIPIPEVIFTDFKIFNKSLSVHDENSPLKKHISYTDTIVLHYNQSVFTINYSALNYTAPLRNSYAYIMEGFEKNWNYVGDKNEATYTNLDPGEYTFKVKVSVNENQWDNKEAKLKIIVLPPFYMTWWFRSLILLAIALILISIYYIRITQIRKLNLQLQRMVDQRTAELEKKNEALQKQAQVLNEANLLLNERQKEIEEKNQVLLQQKEELFQINKLLHERQIQIEAQAEELLKQKEELRKQRDNLDELNNTKDKLFSILGHDLRSPFGTIFGFSDLLYKNLRTYSLDKIEHQLGIIKDAAHNTFTLLNNLLEWSRSQRGIITLECDELLISEVLEVELRMLRQQAQRKEISIETYQIGKEYLICFDLTMISTVIRNLITNAIKFSNKNGKIQIIMNFAKDKFIFSVKDEGIGMSPEKLENLFKVSASNTTKGTAGEKGSGLGLLLCLDFIEKHKGTIWAESEEGKGSSFYFSIPIKCNIPIKNE